MGREQEPHQSGKHGISFAVAEEEIVRYVRKPLTPEQIAELEVLARRPDSEIDLSDIPELGDDFFENAERGRMYLATRPAAPSQIDADILDWFKDQPVSINSVLRDYIAAQRKKTG